MSGASAEPEVVIVGAGLAGLACARVLMRAGVRVVLYEAADGVGGRVRTDVVDGFRLDRGFQVMLPAYAEARRVLHYEDLGLRPFFKGADIFWQGKRHRIADPLRHPMEAVENLFDDVAGWQDRWHTLLLTKETVGKRVLDREGGEEETEDALRGFGFTDGFIDRFFRPFFGGIFLEKDLRTSARMFRYLFAMFARGGAALPARGMQAIPDQLAAGLPEGAIHLNRAALAVAGGRVRLVDGSVVEAPHVVLATSESAAAALLGEAGLGPAKPARSRSVTCLYYAADEAPQKRGILCLDGDGCGPVNNATVVSNVSPELAPEGQHLISATVLGMPESEAMEAEVRRQLARWYGVDTSCWRHLRTYRIGEAQPEGRQLTVGEGPLGAVLAPGLYGCGDYREDVSINGALLSGRRAAEAILEARG